MTPAIQDVLASQVSRDRAYLRVTAALLVVTTALSAAGYAGYLPGSQAFWLGLGGVVVLVGLLPHAIWLALSLSRLSRDLDEGACCQMTGRAAFEETTDCECGVRCFLSIAGLRLRLWTVGDDLSTLRTRVAEGVSVAEYTDHSHILLRVLDARGAAIYHHPDYYRAL